METGLDRDSAKRLLALIVGYESLLLERGLTDYEVTWAINQQSAIVGEVGDLLCELVAEGVLRERDGLFSVPLLRRERKESM